MKLLPIIMLIALQYELIRGNSEKGIAVISKQLQVADNDLADLVLDILLNTLKPYKCVALIADATYYGVFKHTLFEKFGIYLSFFVIYVQESEDLLSPFPPTKQCLIKIKDHGCQIYVILISNGQQVSRLLRYGDRYRILDTRAKFVMLHDNRLFQKPLYYLWKRIVNVVFIKEYNGLKRVGGITVTIPWFELSTVPFPSPIQSIFIPKRLDTWRKSKFRIGANLFQDKTRDLRNQSMHVVIMKHTPATTKISFIESDSVRAVMRDRSQNFAGLEVEILASVSEAMNFKCDVYEASNSGDFWGKKQAGTKYTGLIGEMVNNHADVALGDLYYTSYVLELMDLTVPYNTECLTFLTPESLTDNSWKTLILPFKLITWLLVILCLFLGGIIFHYLALFHSKIDKIKKERMKTIQIDINKKRKKKILTLPIISVDQLKPNCKYVLMKKQLAEKQDGSQPNGLYLFTDFFNSILYTYSMHLMVALPRVPSGWSLRMLTGWYWIYCTLVTVSYRASMTAILANPAPRVTIDTLQELINSKISLGGWGEVNGELFRTSRDPITQIIGANFEFVNDTVQAVERVSQGNFALYENTYFLKEASVIRQLNQQASSAENQTGDRKLHIMESCVINMPISIGLQKNSPIKPRVDKYIRRVVEAGFIRKWLDDVMQTTLNAEAPNTLETTKALMGLRKFIGAMVALSIGYFVSLVALCVELAYFHFAVRRHPNFNKYSRKIRT